MQIYRKCRHYSDWCAEGVFADTWKSWGFIDAYTGEEIQPNEAYHGDYSLNLEPFTLNKTYWYYKWRYDTVDSYNHFLFTNGYTANVNSKNTCLGFNLSNKQYFTGKNNNVRTMDSNYDSISNRLTYLLGQYGSVESSTSRAYAQYFNLFFIPLKNNGFLFNYESSCGAAGDVSGRGLPIELSTYYKQTSPLLWDLYSYRHISNYSGSARNPSTSFATVIGFYNNIDNQMNYIKIVVPDTVSVTYDTDIKDCYTNWDYKKNSISTSISCMDEDGSYTDVKENICTLIKYPYETGALSNLFIISTCPERKKRQFIDPSILGPANEPAPDNCGLEGKFFSFNGRNFYGFYNNLAVELPSN